MADEHEVAQGEGLARVEAHHAPPELTPEAAQAEAPATISAPVGEIAHKPAPKLVPVLTTRPAPDPTPTVSAEPALETVAAVSTASQPETAPAPVMSVPPIEPAHEPAFEAAPVVNAVSHEERLRSTVVLRAPARVSTTARVGAVVCGVAVVAVVLLAVLRAGGIGVQSTVSLHRVTSWIPATASSLVNDSQQTAPSFAFPSSAPEGLTVDPIFSAAYEAHGGAALLGEPMTPAFPTADGMVQFFTAGGLIAEDETSTTPNATQASANTATTMTIESIPVVSTLLAKGSLATIGGDDGSLTYAALRAAALPDKLQAIPPSQPQDGVFFAEGNRDGTVIGHTIAQQLYEYISDSTVSPNGWQQGVGLPLTEALSATATVNGSVRSLLVQAFTNVVLVCDVTSGQAAEQTVAPASAGIAYLRTFAPPAARLASGAQFWSTGSVALASLAGGSTASVHLGENYPLTAASDGQAAQWVNGALWYHVRWSAPKQSGEGWAPAATLTFTSPGSAPAYASFDVLSPSIQNYLAGYSSRVSAVVFDETRNIYYTYNPTGRFTLASSAKVPIMLAFLTMTEHQGREPNSYEMATLATMIENSNNNSAQALYELAGEDNGLRAFLASVGIHDWTSNPDGWGWSSFSPTSMVYLLTLLQDGKVLTTQDRALALNLMGHIQSDQQIGVGDTAPQGATVAMKDGWVTGPDGLWAVNSSGIVTVGGETYMIAVYSQHFGDITTGWDIVNTVCGDVGKALV